MNAKIFTTRLPMTITDFYQARALKAFLFLLLMGIGVKGWGQVNLATFNFENSTLNPNAGAIGSPVLTASASVSYFGGSTTSPTASACFASANTKYFELTISTLGYNSITLNWNARTSATTSSWVVTANSGSGYGGTLATQTLSTTFAAATPLVLSNAFNNNSSIKIRWTANVSATQTIRIDDIVISGTSAVNPTIDISAGSIGSSNVNQGAVNVILQQYNFAVTDANATLNGLTVNTAGTYVAGDITNLKVRYSTDATLDAGDATLSTKTTGLGAGAQVFPAFTSQVINNGSTGYIFVTADIEPTATAGSTINVDPTSFANISFAGTVNKTGTDPVPAGGTKTFVAVTPQVVLSSPSPAVPAANLSQNSTDNVIYRFDLAVTTANAVLDGVTISTASGNNIAGDIDNFKCWYSADDVFNAGTDQLLSTKSTFNQAGTQVFPSFTNKVILAGTTGYIFITASLPCAATNSNTVIVDAITTADISFVSANESGTANAGGTQTIVSATPVNATGAGASNLNQSSSVSWNNPTGCYQEVMIVAATAANNGTPTGDGSAYTANLTYGNGTALGNGFVVYKGTGSPQTVTGLTNGTTYHFKLFTRNDLLWSSGVEVTATPATQIMPGEILINQMSPDYGTATDEYVELVNTTNKSLDLSTLKLNYRSSSGGGSNTTTLSGTILPQSFWLLCTNATVTVGQTIGVSRDGSFGSGFASSDGQIAILRVSDDVKIDGVGYGNLTGGTYVEGTAASNPPTDGGLRRVLDGADANNNSSDFTTVTNANIYLRNSSSRLANTGAVIAAGSYENLSVTGNASLAGNVTLTKRISLNAGALTIGANTLTTNNAVSTSGTLSGSATSNLTINGAAGTLNFTGGSNTLKNLLLNTGATATLGNALTITGGTAPATEGTVVVNSGATLTSGGNLTLQSNSFGTARVGNSAGTINGNVTVERYIANANAGVAGRKWRLLSGQATTTTQSVFDSWQEGGAAVNDRGTWITSNTHSGSNGFDATSLSSSILTHNPAAPSWETPAATNAGALSSNQGYMLFVRGDRTALPGNTINNPTVLRSTGTLKQGNQPAILIANSNLGFTLIGNPFASPIDLENLLSTTNLSQTFQVWDATATGNFGVGGYRAVTKTGPGTYTATPSSGNDASLRYIHSGQAFFVKTDGIGDASLVLTESHKAADLSVVNPIAPVTGNQQIYTELASVNPGNVEAVVDGIRVWYNPAFSAEVNSDDIVKMSNFGENLSSYRTGKRLIIELRPTIGTKDTIFLRTSNLGLKDYRFKINTFDFVQSNLSAFLEDAWLNTSTPINLNGSVNTVNFSVTADAASANPDRFRIVFASAGPLPVTITSLKAAQQGGNIAVEWKASNQLNMKQYEVEKSTDGINFSKVNTQQTIGVNGSDATYTWLDQNPATGNNFYRIRSVGANGDEKLTQVVVVRIGKGSPAIMVYPSPVVNRTMNLLMTDTEKGIYLLRLVNTAGQLVFSKTINHPGGSATQSIVLDKYVATGNYRLEIRKPGQAAETRSILITE